ncbi:hypothetical protein [Corynebacterium sp.]|uniref:hypothetical protein n=1 Tax=Corynebacterium sp. TaxID=1720 RepID=UPI0026DEF076|nr:hypothetical protein [Corynebacterium sp.]MDO5513326.1 hypothetical protein [Corynebacterium sp.]
MNPATIKMLLDAFSTVRERVQDYNEKKAREAYDLLSDAADRVDFDGLRSRGEELLDEGRREAGNVTQAAHDRLDSAKKRLAKVADNTPARKRAKKARIRRNWSLAGLAALLVAAIGGAVYWFTRQQQAPGDTPPRVEDFSGADTTEAPATESTLVYSTETPGSPEEGVAERDEELLGSLDDQLSKHRQAAEDEAGEFEVTEDDPINEETVDDVTDPDAESGDNK